MSGIFGIVHKHEAPVTAQSLDTVQAAMAAWGPDGHGRWHSDRVALGHLMLHTTPESLDERQPYRHPADIELVIVADARIDNRDDLFAALGIPCVERQGMPDSALILHAYAAWGERCSEHLLSAFAFAVWDGRQRQLFCARDHVGLKPFYYYDAPQCLVFASDLKGVLACPHVPQRLHEALLAAFLQQDTDFAEKTLSFFDGVCKLPPAHQLRLNRSRCQLESYWFIDDVPDVRLSSDAAYVEQFRALLRQAVDCRLRAAFPVGSHLSGGLDSSLVTILAPT
ncbi:hypothetical protein C2W62_39570 [Candidatus Entotheonella serta]|nr:hypothetical protein C2W62_39570 [Candidatus Entotheonella serta]